MRSRSAYSVLRTRALASLLPADPGSDYLHLDPCLVELDDRVQAGSWVGIIGADKRRKNDLLHLHFQLWLWDLGAEKMRLAQPEPYLMQRNLRVWTTASAPPALIAT